MAPELIYEGDSIGFARVVLLSFVDVLVCTHLSLTPVVAFIAVAVTIVVIVVVARVRVVSFVVGVFIADIISVVIVVIAAIEVVIVLIVDPGIVIVVIVVFGVFIVVTIVASGWTKETPRPRLSNAFLPVAPRDCQPKGKARQEREKISEYTPRKRKKWKER